MKRNRNLIIAIVLSTTAGLIAVQNGLAPSNGTATETPTHTSTPTAASASYGGCAYTWAYHDAPELSEELNMAVQAIEPKATANISLFGEDCTLADGTSTFGAMETDFYVHLPVEEITNEKAFGDWIAQVMPLIEQLPSEQIQGNYGFVEFWFEKTESEHLVLRIPVQEYAARAQGKTGAELFRLFYNVP